VVGVEEGSEGGGIAGPRLIDGRPLDPLDPIGAVNDMLCLHRITPLAVAHTPLCLPALYDAREP
jgi:hypothetical protein